MSAPAAATGIIAPPAAPGAGVSNVERSVRFYVDVLGFEVGKRLSQRRSGIPGSGDDHNPGCSSRRDAEPDERVARMYHAAWEVGGPPTRRAAQT